MSKPPPRVAVITPTWQRRERLLNRCIPSVQAQAYPGGIVHVVVSDGPDPDLAAELHRLADDGAFYYPVTFLQLPEHDEAKHWGHAARLAGIEASSAEYVAYLDDDDCYRPHHVAALARVLDDNPEAGWAYSVMASHSNAGSWTEIGQAAPAVCQIGTPMIMHRREILTHGTWGPASATEDWELVARWLDAGIAYRHLHEVTVDVWPSAYW